MKLHPAQRFAAPSSIQRGVPLKELMDQSNCLTLLQRWATDPNPHVRRLVSEGTRPRLPWAMRLPEFQEENPGLSLPLLEALKDDSELYVRRSVANHLGDIAKDHPDVTFARCEAWLAELEGVGEPAAGNRKWIVRHAVRHPAQKGNPRALALRALAAARKPRNR